MKLTDSIADKNSVSYARKLPDKSTKSRLSFADGLRGIAALWVVFFHMAGGHHIETLKSILPSMLYKIFFSWGDLGVAIFFVLSGFVMALTAYKVKFNLTNSVCFIARRLIRIVPPYYFAIAVTLLLIIIKTKALNLVYIAPSIKDLMSHAFFLQGVLNTPYINQVYWTLCIEVQFYIVFACLLWVADYIQIKFNIANSRNIVVVIACYMALLWPFDIISTTIWNGGFVGFWYSFLAGVIICWGWLNKGSTLKLAIGYCLILFVAGLIHKSGFILVVAMTASLLLFAGLRERMYTWLNWSWLQFLALISYSLYLLHNPITGASFNITNRLFSTDLTREIVGMSIALVACLVVSYLSFLMIERSSINWSHKITLRKTSILST